MFSPVFLNKELREKWDLFEENYRINESILIENLLKSYAELSNFHPPAEAKAQETIRLLRANKPSALRIESLLHSYRLSTQEGLALMSLAEALLRIPDNSTKTKLIHDKLELAEWKKDAQQNWLERLANFSLIQVSKFLSIGTSGTFLSHIPGLVRRFGEPVIRQIMEKMIRTMGGQFVVGQTIEKAFASNRNELFSFDMLGEAAKTRGDAKRYFDAYLNAISALKDKSGNKEDKSSISIKLSALHPRYEVLKRDIAKKELTESLLKLCQAAKDADIFLTVDAEETDRLQLSLEIFHDVYIDDSLKGWGGLGLAVQAYQKRAHVVIDWLVLLAKSHQEKMHIRLVKGAYWDSEIKWCQERGLEDYPVFTQKPYTDLSYLVCAAKILDASDLICPQFATHNAYTLCFVSEMAEQKGVKNYEFQRLYGMGESLYDHIKPRYRIYGPVGSYHDLLSYLVRRLLENGANNSFVSQIYDTQLAIEFLTKDISSFCAENQNQPHPGIKLPGALFGESRRNSKGKDLSSYEYLEHTQKALYSYFTESPPEILHLDQLKKLLEIADHAQPSWEKFGPERRAAIFEKLGDLLDKKQEQLIQILSTEARKTIGDCLAEIREAIDFCYYYASQARALLANPVELPGPTGEVNTLSYHARGVFVCIAPWNFPLAIFLGQAVAALITGNSVLVKPAHQTPRIGLYALNLAYQAGVPKDVFQFIHARGSEVSELLNDAKIKGVVFTGSTDTAININKALANRPGLIIPLIAETGGMNAMIVDSSALLEQVVTDVIMSAFQSAGQRCSALRFLFIQEDIANSLLLMLSEATRELTVGPSINLSTDIGPVIDGDAKEKLKEHIAYLTELEKTGKTKRVFVCDVPQEGDYVGPEIWEIEQINLVKEEVFGPIIHVIRFKADHLEKVIQQINDTGYGLTMGIHSRLESTISTAERLAKVGNLYINRNMIGAVVGVQPFGGEGLSGTGPKAGGPNYLGRFVVERTFTQNTTASGGNTTLLSSL